jgi:hypothetical protein
MTELYWGESTISLHGCSADRPHHQNNNNNGSIKVRNKVYVQFIRGKKYLLNYHKIDKKWVKP